VFVTYFLHMRPAPLIRSMLERSVRFNCMNKSTVYTYACMMYAINLLRSFSIWFQFSASIRDDISLLHCRLIQNHLHVAFQHWTNL